jgi:hypothetical protein
MPSRNTALYEAEHPDNAARQNVTLADAPAIVAAAMRLGFCQRPGAAPVPAVKPGTNPEPDRVYAMAASVDITLARWLRSKAAPREIRIKEAVHANKLTYYVARRALMRWAAAGWLKPGGQQMNTKFYTLTNKGISRCQKLTRH